jgi:hypothetical protein
MPAGKLNNVSLSAAIGVPVPTPETKLAWSVKLKVDDSEYTAITQTRIVLAVLQSALLTGPQKKKWPVTIGIEDKGHSISRVRIDDDRGDCKSTFSARPDGEKLTPLTPTAFGDENPPKWGFFFNLGDQCGEYKGTGLDVYDQIENAWRDSVPVVLIFGDHDRIVGVKVGS